MSQIIFESIIKDFKTYLEAKPTGEQAMKYVCEVIDHRLDYYDWIGFYLVSKTEERMLELGPYVGEHTDHVKIPFGKGICGQTAESQETFLIDDVTKEDNYIACSIHVKSEIVVPMFKNDLMIGQIDIDSSKINAFNEGDEIFLKQICSLISPSID
ncbi:MAG: GAF domain-containing protein [Flavobacteriales bacterium]